MNTKPFRPDVDAPTYKGRYTPYDIIKEGTIAIVVVAILTFGLAVFFGSPDEHAVTIKTWSNAAPLDFAATAVAELNGTSITGAYGPPYNTAAEGQKIGPLTITKWIGDRIHIDTVKDFVIDPLKSQPNQPALTQALATWSGASSSTRSGWVADYTKASANMKFTNGHIVVTSSNSGPVPVLVDSLTQMAQSGALDQALVTGNGFFTTDYTKPLLFVADSGYFPALADKQHLMGTQWGMMNETGSYPGQAWLWLFSFWYQIPPFNSTWGANADIAVFAVMAILSLGLLFLPFIPGLRSIPRWTRVYRLVWREHYKSNE